MSHSIEQRDASGRVRGAMTPEVIRSNVQKTPFERLRTLPFREEPAARERSRLSSQRTSERLLSVSQDAPRHLFSSSSGFAAGPSSREDDDKRWERIMYWGLIGVIITGLVAALSYLRLPQFISFLVGETLGRISMSAAGFLENAGGVFSAAGHGTFTATAGPAFLHALPVILAILATVAVVLLLLRGFLVSHQKKRAAEPRFFQPSDHKK